MGNEFKTIKLGLERIQTLLDALGNPHRSQRYVHVAGTNGKGSTCAMIESGLRATGLRTGLYTSPHLVRPTERIQIEARPVGEDAFAWAFQEVHQTAESLVSGGRIDMHPTYFETLTAMAHLLFRRERIDIAVLETGMGGRLDATNVVQPELAVITPIDFDHQQYLGATIPLIAAEKAGIIKERTPVVFSRQRPEAQAVLERRAHELSARPVHASSWRAERLEISESGSRFAATGPGRIEIECPLVGAHQVENALTAVAALTQLGVAPEAIRQGIAATRWPGRLERVRSKPMVFLDGAHNAAGASALADYIREFHAGRTVWMVFGAMRDKDLSVIAPLLFPLASHLYFTAPNQARSFRPSELREGSGETRAGLIEEPAGVLRLLETIPPADAVFITGSLYLVGELRPLLVP